MSPDPSSPRAGLRFAKLRVARHSAEIGFTLIEVLVALAILSVALPVVISVFSDSLRRTRESEARQIASAYAESLLDEAGTEKSLNRRVESGDFGDGHFHWRLTIEPYGTPADHAAWPVSAFTVTATVTWGEGRKDQAVSLTTLRLAPKVD